MSPPLYHTVQALQETNTIFSTERNRSQSPFLRLPPEIRNRVHRYVLGGHHIHISPYGDGLLRSICIARHTDREVAQAIGTGECLESEHGILDLHDDCFSAILDSRTRIGVRIDLALLVVCREINYEAALLPFQINTFVFGNFNTADSAGEGLRTFDQRLIPAQRNAVVSISMKTTTHLECKHIIKFDGLQDLTILGNAFRAGRLRHSLVGELDSSCLERIAEALNFKGWKSMVIGVVNELGEEFDKETNELQQQAREIERKLLLPRDAA